MKGFKKLMTALDCPGSHRYQSDLIVHFSVRQQ